MRAAMNILVPPPCGGHLSTTDGKKEGVREELWDIHAQTERLSFTLEKHSYSVPRPSGPAYVRRQRRYEAVKPSRSRFQSAQTWPETVNKSLHMKVPRQLEGELTGKGITSGDREEKKGLFMLTTNSESSGFECQTAG